MTMTVLGTLKTLLSPLGGGKDAVAPAGGDGSVDFAAMLDGAGEATLPQGLALAVAAAPVAALGMPAQLGAATEADLPSAHLAAALGLAVKTSDADADAPETAAELPATLPGITPAAKPEKPVRTGEKVVEQFSREISKMVRSESLEEPESSDMPAPEAEMASADDAPLPLPTPDVAVLPSAMGPIVATAQALPAGSPLGTAVNEPSVSTAAVDRPHPLVASAPAAPVMRNVRLAQEPAPAKAVALPIAENAAPAEEQAVVTPQTSNAMATAMVQPAVTPPISMPVSAPTATQPAVTADIRPASSAPIGTVAPVVSGQAAQVATPVTPAPAFVSAAPAPQASAPRDAEQATVAVASADPVAAAPEVPARTMRQLRESIQAQPGEATALLRMLSEAIGGKSVPLPAAKDAPVVASAAQAVAAPVIAATPRDISTNVAARPERSKDEAVKVDVAQAATDAAPHAADRPQHIADPTVVALRAPQAAQSMQAQPLDLSATLGQQVIDMSSGGQWIDGLAREIATLSKGDGQGSFRLSPEHLGPMRVDIRNSDQGAQVTLTVETETAQNMLQQDSGRLKADAQLSSVRIADVVVERVHHIAEPSRADSSMNQGNGGQQPQHQASAQAGFAQGQGQSQQNTQSNNKTSGGQAVLNHAEPQDRTVEDDGQGGSRRARYA